MIYHVDNYKSINRIIYYLIKHVTTKSSAKHVDRLLKLLLKCFSCFNKYKIVGKGWVKCTINSINFIT